MNTCPVSHRYRMTAGKRDRRNRLFPGFLSACGRLSTRVALPVFSTLIGDWHLPVRASPPGRAYSKDSIFFLPHLSWTRASSNSGPLHLLRRPQQFLQAGYPKVGVGGRLLGTRGGSQIHLATDLKLVLHWALSIIMQTFGSPFFCPFYFSLGSRRQRKRS